MKAHLVGLFFCFKTLFINAMMAVMKAILTEKIKGVLMEMGVAELRVSLDYPAMPEMGDYSTSVAMAYAKTLGIPPKELAEKIKNTLEVASISHVSKIEVAGPGFVNIFFTPEYWSGVVEKILEKGVEFGHETHVSGQRMIIEYTQPNPFKEFHIGHMMNNVIGESVSRILEARGAEVIRATYHGDVGLHVAKAVWGMQNMGVGTDIDVAMLGKAYSTGAQLFETDEDVKKEIIALNKKIYDRSDDEINNLYDAGLRVSLYYFEKMYARLGSTFDHHFYESQSGPIGKKLVEEFLEKGVFEKSDGAVIFPGEKYTDAQHKNLHTRVFLSSEGLPTYECKEVGLARMKKDLFGPYDLSVTVTANEQDAFFRVVEKSLEQVFPDLTGKLLHLSHGMLKLPTGKMSSRTGDVVTAEAMIDMVKDSAQLKIKEGVKSAEMKEDIAEMVALAAIKYTILRQAIGGDIIFDLERAVSLEGDSGPYLQYSVVRAKSVLRKVEKLFPQVGPVGSELPEAWQTTNLERMLERYLGVIERAAKEYAPHHLVTYLTELASEFNSFYASHKIIDGDDLTSPYRLSLTEAFVDVMTSGLGLLGIKIPQEM